MNSRRCESSLDHVPDGAVVGGSHLERLGIIRRSSGDLLKWGRDLLKLPREIREGYVIVRSAGEGTYGKVFLAQSVQDRHEFVAIKILSLARRMDGIPATSVKEVALLKDLKHENIVE